MKELIIVTNPNTAAVVLHERRYLVNPLYIKKVFSYLEMTASYKCINSIRKSSTVSFNCVPFFNYTVKFSTL